MKRIMSLLLSLMLFLCPLALAEESGFPGVWIETDGYGTLTILADGYARMEYYDSSVIEFNWILTDEGAKFTDGMWYNSPMKLLDENTLSVSNGWMIFAREGFLPTTDEALLLGAEPVGEEGEPFLGGWELTMLIVEGEELPPSFFGMTMNLTFNANGTVVTDDGMEPYTTTWMASYGNAVVEGDILILDENDQLILNTSDGSMIFTRIPEPEEIPPVTEEPLPIVEDEPVLVGEEEPALQGDPLPVGDEGAPFLGMWTLDSMLLDGEPINPALFGMSMTLTFNADGTVVSDDGMGPETALWHVEDDAAVSDDIVLRFNEDGNLFMEEDGSAMFFIRTDGTEEPQELSEEEQLLALLQLLEMMGGFEEDLSALPENHQGFVGEWQLCYVMTGGLTGDLRSLGITGTLTLNADYSGELTGLADETGTWYEDEEGVIRFGENGMPMFLIDATEDGMGMFLQYGTEASGCMIFHQEAEAAWTPGLYPLQTPAVTAETTAPAASGGDFRLGVKYVCTSYSVGGVPYDASALGAEYAVLFREDGMADFTMAGFTMTNLGCSVADDGTRTIHYVGNDIPCVATAGGIDMNYFGIIYHMVPAE